MFSYNLCFPHGSVVLETNSPITVGETITLDKPLPGMNARCWIRKWRFVQIRRPTHQKLVGAETWLGNQWAEVDIEPHAE